MKTFLALLFFSLFCFAEEPILSTESNSKFDNTKHFLISSFIEIPTHSFLISTSAGRMNQKQVDQRVQYNPTFGPNFGLKAQFNDLSLTLSKKFSFIDAEEEKKYGKTNYDDIRFDFLVTENTNIETYYQSYRGFYTDLSGQEGLQSTFDNNGTSTPAPSGPTQIIRRTDISALNYGARATYKIPLMPFIKLFEKEEDQVKLDWEFNILTKLYYNHLRISGDQALVPSSSLNGFSPIASLNEFSTDTLGSGLGLGLSVQMSSQSQMGFAALLGLGLQRQNNIFSSTDSVNYTSAQEMNANMYFDWKGQTHGIRTDLYLESYSSKVDDIHFDSMNMGIQLNYSYNGLTF